MFNLGQIIPTNFNIEAYGKYSNSFINQIYIDFKANCSGRQRNIVISIRISIKNLNFTIEKLRK